MATPTPPTVVAPDGDAPGPRRTCVGCRRRRSPADLIRIVRSPDGSLLVGRTLPGRGAWLCAGNLDCLDIGTRRGGLARSFRTPLGAGALAELRSTVTATTGISTHDFVPGHPPARN